MARPRSGGTIPAPEGGASPPTEASPEATGATEKTEATGPGTSGQAGTASQEKALGKLPTTKTTARAGLEGRTVLLYGPPKVGKSTLASQFGKVFFIDTEGGLSELEVYRESAVSWTGFLGWCASVARQPDAFDWVCVDTVTALLGYCREYVYQKHGIKHESDLEFGTGWDLVKTEFQRPLTKLGALNIGVILVGHSTDREIKSRNEEYTYTGPALTKGVASWLVSYVDFALFISEEEEGRTIHTKNSRYHAAGDRTGRLPAEIPWPVGTDGYGLLQAALKP